MTPILKVTKNTAFHDVLLRLWSTTMGKFLDLCMLWLFWADSHTECKLRLWHGSEILLCCLWLLTDNTCKFDLSFLQGKSSRSCLVVGFCGFTKQELRHFKRNHSVAKLQQWYAVLGFQWCSFYCEKNMSESQILCIFLPVFKWVFQFS